MGEGLHVAPEKKKRLKKPLQRHHSFDSSSDEEERMRILDRRRKFEATQDDAVGQDPIHSADSIAEDAMLRGGKVSDEPWDGDPEEEKDHFVQEELYVHAKVVSTRSS